MKYRMPATLIPGDCLTALDKIPTGCIDLILTSIPGLNERDGWGVSVPLNRFVEINGIRYEYEAFMLLMYISGVSCIEAQVRWDDSWQEGLWDKYRRILAPDGVVVLFSSGWRTAQIITGATIPWRYNLVWHKVFNGVTPLTQHEDICVFSHFTPAEKQPRNVPSVLSYPVAKDGLGRWCAKPLDLCQKLICNYSEFDGRVLDNCMGEGIVGKAALRMGRQFVGIEKDVQKFRKACKEVHSVEYAEGIVN